MSATRRSTHRPRPQRRFALPGALAAALLTLGSLAPWSPCLAQEDGGLFLFIRGDANSDDVVDVSDVVASLTCQFGGESCPECFDVLDVDDSGETDISDPVNLLNYLFQGGPRPALPFPTPGPDPTLDDVVCDEEQADESPLEISVDPDLDLDRGVDIDALREEALGTGPLELADGDHLEGRVVCEGLHIPDDTEVTIMEGTEIVAVGDSYLGGTLVPVDDPDHVEPGFEDDEDDERAPRGGNGGGAGGTPSGIPPSCGGVARNRPVAHGKSYGRPTSMTFLGNVVAPAFRCPAAAARIKDAPPANVVGAPSARARGGRGGTGQDIEIHAVGLGSTLTILGPICNEHGGDGGDANATGLDGAGCGACGGDAWARAGDGGRSGHLLIVSPRIVWGAFGPAVTVYPGGRGGDASAIAGKGGDCDVCGQPGGRGGHASAMGGKAGRTGSVRIIANTMENVGGARVSAGALLLAADLPDGARGGHADAGAGTGGRGGGDDDCDCGETAGDGGPGGDAYARAAKAAGGVFGHAVDRGGPGGLGQTTRGTDGGHGGRAEAVAGRGGDGADAVDCECDDLVVAGRGGDGGDGGGADANGGDGGGARWGPEPMASGDRPTVGDGGAASTSCGGDGGDGGKGGDCRWSPGPRPAPQLCISGLGGEKGDGGLWEKQPGRSGLARQRARDRDDENDDRGFCVDGAPGGPGVEVCPRPPPGSPAVICIRALRDVMVEVVPDPWRQQLGELLDQVMALLGRGQIEPALNQLERFLQEVSQLLDAGQIPPDLADVLIAQAEACRQGIAEAAVGGAVGGEPGGREPGGGEPGGEPGGGAPGGRAPGRGA